MFKDKIKEIWKEHRSRIVIVLIIILASSVAFQIGLLRGNSFSKKPLIVEKPASSAAFSVGTSLAPEKQESVETQVAGGVEKKEFQFVGSKNSNKYHLPSCRFAKNIKEENLVYFVSEEDAQSRGYIPHTCVKE